MGTRSYPGVKRGRGVPLTTHPLLVPRSWKSRAIPLPTLWTTPGLSLDHFKIPYLYSITHNTSIKEPIPAKFASKLHTPSLQVLNMKQLLHTPSLQVLNMKQLSEILH